MMVWFTWSGIFIPLILVFVGVYVGFLISVLTVLLLSVVLLRVVLALGRFSLVVCPLVTESSCWTSFVMVLPATGGLVSVLSLLRSVRWRLSCR